MNKKSLLFLMCAASLSGYAQQFDGGEGTAENPYQIATAEQLRAIANDQDKHYIQTADIDLSTYGNWGAICNDFTGVYDGNGKAIIGLSINAPWDGGQGLFGTMHTPGVIKNVTIVDADIICGSWSGILVGTNGNWQTAGGTIENCAVYNSKISGASCIGGISGVIAGNIIGCCVVNCVVEGTDDNVGGIYGTNDIGCEVSGNTVLASVKGPYNVGGIAGIANGGMSLTDNISYGYAANAANTANKGVGGITGYKNNNTTLKHCASTMDISGTNAGGISGPTMNDISECYSTGNIASSYPSGGNPWCGGIVATQYDGTMSQCYFSGTIAGDGWNGGLSGRKWATQNVVDCYWNKDGVTHGSNGSDGDATGEWGAADNWTCAGLTPEQMLDFSNYVGFSTDVWQHVEGETPFFTNQLPPVEVIEKESDNTIFKGSCGDYTPDELWLMASESGFFSTSVDAELDAADGTWSVTLPVALANDEQLSIIAVKQGFMPSLPTSIVVSNATSGLEKAIDRKSITRTGDTLLAPVGTTLNIYNVSGARVAISRGETGFNLNNLPAGIYIATTGNDTIKVVVK